MSDASAAIYYEPDGFDTSRTRLMGRHVAGESFLAAMARHASARELVAVSASAAHFADFKARVRATVGGSRTVRWIPSGSPDALAGVGCLFYPGVPAARWAWTRRRLGPRSFSLCGVTHTTASERAMHAIGELLVAPFQPWDAMVCTSRAVRDMVETLLDGYGAYLDERFRCGAVLRPSLPVIPLGVDCNAVEPGDAARARGAALRERIGVPPEALVVLFVGRLSYHGKAHPLPLYLALERASRNLKQPLCLLLAGWFANDAIRDRFVEGARRYCPSVRLLVVDGRRPEIRRDVWHAADVFASPSDNVQETFGLTPVEAMAAGLPSVISDWNGYRDGPRHGVEGFLVPTWLPSPGSGEILAQRHQQGTDDYDHYIGRASQFAAVEVEPMQQALEMLLGDATRRREMGARARERALAVYDWSVVIAQYEELWAELAKRRESAQESRPVLSTSSATPLNADPFTLFAGYPTRALDDQTRVALGPGAGAESLDAFGALALNRLAEPLLCESELRERVIGVLLELGEASCAELVAALEPDDPSALRRTLVWLAKLDLLRLRAPPVASTPGAP